MWRGRSRRSSQAASSSGSLCEEGSDITIQQTIILAIHLLAQGMAGIFTVLGLIALAVALLGRLDKNRQG